MTRAVNEDIEEPQARRAGWSHDWQPRWSHEPGRKPLRPVPCSWQATTAAPSPPPRTRRTVHPERHRAHRRVRAPIMNEKPLETPTSPTTQALLADPGQRLDPMSTDHTASSRSRTPRPTTPMWPAEVCTTRCWTPSTSSTRWLRHSRAATPRDSWPTSHCRLRRSCESATFSGKCPPRPTSASNETCSTSNIAFILNWPRRRASRAGGCRSESCSRLGVAAGDQQSRRPSLAVGGEVDLAGHPASGAADRVVTRLGIAAAHEGIRVTRSSPLCPEPGARRADAPG